MRAEASELRARYLDLDELRQALTVARDLLGKVAAEVGERRPEKLPSAGRVGVERTARPRAAAAPVAKASSVSEVEVSPSIVIALKLFSDGRGEACL